MMDGQVIAIWTIMAIGLGWAVVMTGLSLLFLYDDASTHNTEHAVSVHAR